MVKIIDAGRQALTNPNSPRDQPEFEKEVTTEPRLTVSDGAGTASIAGTKTGFSTDRDDTEMARHFLAYNLTPVCSGIHIADTSNSGATIATGRSGGSGKGR